jgi:hypothetical protein
MGETRTATFDSIVSGTDLSAYTEGNLIISTPASAYVDYSHGWSFPSAPRTHPGFSAGFFYPNGGVNASIAIKTADNVDIYDVKFNAGSGFRELTDVNLRWEMYDGALLVSSGQSKVLKGTQVDFSYQDGFDYLLVYGERVWGDGYNALALDNLIVDTSAATSVPEPTTLLLLGLGLVGIAGVKKKFNK